MTSFTFQQAKNSSTIGFVIVPIARQKNGRHFKIKRYKDEIIVYIRYGTTYTEVEKFNKETDLFEVIKYCVEYYDNA